MIKKIDLKVHSLDAAPNYEQALTRLTKWLQKNKLGDLKTLNYKQRMFI